MNNKELFAKICDYLKEHHDEMIATWRDFVNTESWSKEPETVNIVAAKIKAEFEKAGMECRLEDMSPNGNALVGIIGKDRPGKPIVFGGHYDTVFPKGTFGDNPFRIEDGKAYGPGALDMKGGITISLYVIKALEHIGWKENPIKIIYAGDEEIGHRGSKCGQLYLDESEGGLFGFNMETGLIDNALCIGRKGSLNANITVNGRESHAGNDFTAGISAIEEMCHKILKIQKLTDLEKGTTVNTGVIKGGTVPNAVPQECSAVVDIRIEDWSEKDRIYAEIEKIVKESTVEGTSATVEFVDGLPIYETTPGVMKFFDHVVDVATDYALPIPTGKRLGGGSDASYITMAGTPVICSFGVRGQWNHTKREYAVVDAMEERAKLIAAVILEKDKFVL